MFGRTSDPNLIKARQLRTNATKSLQKQLKNYINNVQRLEGSNRNNNKIFQILQFEKANHSQYMRQIQRALANLVIASKRNLWAARNAELAAIKSKEQNAERKAAVQKEMANIRALGNAQRAEQERRAAKNAANLNSILSKIFKGLSTNENKKKKYIITRSSQKNRNSAINRSERGLYRLSGAPIPPKYLFLWANNKPAPPPPGPSPAMKQVQNKKVFVKNASGQNTTQQINMTRNVNSSGTATNWTFRNSQVNTSKYAITNANKNTPIVTLNP